MTQASVQNAGRNQAGRGRSLRTQLVAWNILALALLLAVLGGIVRYTVQKTIMASVDADLARQTQPHGGGGPGGPPPDAPPPQPRPNDPPPVQGSQGPPPGTDSHDHEFRPGRGPGGHPHHDDGENPYHARFFTPQGHSFNPSDHETPWDLEALSLAARGQVVYSNVTVNDVPLRVLSHPVPPQGPYQGVVQAAYPLTDVRRAMAGVDSALLILIPVALICAGLGGAALTDRVLARVRQMTQAAGRISGRNFAARLPVSGQDEFSALATTFNAMLGRQEEAFEQQRRFTADASHELKTPLTIIKGNTSMALSLPPTPAEFQQTLQEIDRAADTMQRLVQDLLLLARSDSGQLGRDRIVLMVSEILERAVSGVARRGGVPIRLSTPDASLSVCGTEDELVRLFGNLLDNAMRHTPPGGHVTVEACHQGSNALISVTDTGSGIAPEHLPHLGERFYRVDSARARPDGGTGLGLSICCSIVEAHRGTLTFESRLGVGTTVHVSLPTEGSPSLNAMEGRATLMQKETY